MLGPRPLKKDVGPSFRAMSFTTFQMTLALFAYLWSLYSARRVLTTQNGVVMNIETIPARSEIITVVNEFGFFGS